MIIPSVLLFIDNIKTYIKVYLTISHGKKDSASTCGTLQRVTKQVEKKGDVMNRFSRLLGEFSRNSQRAKLTQQLNKKVEAPEANANGTSGYLIKEGKNAGKVLKHLKTDRTKL